MTLGKSKITIGFSPLEILTPKHFINELVMKDGELFWRESGNGRRKKGAGCLIPKRPVVCFRGHVFYMDEVAYTVQTGKFPTGKIIHLDGDKTNNRLENLHVIPETQEG